MGKTLEELMAELEKQARERIKFSETDPAATAYEDSEKTVPEDSIVSEKPVSERGSGVYEKGQTILDTYTVESDPIHGGMGSVWRVHHNNWNVDLAMKRPQAKLFQSERQKENFIGECEAWINLGLHPNIVSCYYIREIDGVPTIFSEWMENGSLENHIKKGTLYTGSEQEQQERLLDIAIQFARGLHYAHEQGLIHQDVKPDNVLLSKDWDAKVADFGLAKARAQLTILEGENTVRDAGATVMAPSGGYTPAYCSMEQMDGKPLTRRTDIYSWAVSVMETYLGERLWDNGVVAGYACESYFADCRVKMPEELKNLLKKCMSPQPEDRPHDFTEIEAELQKIYRAATGSDYPRPASTAAADTADSLNNRALSYLDMGKTDEAERLWKKAVRLNERHLESVYNLALYEWRRAVITDREACDRLAACFDDSLRWNDLLTELHSEQGDFETIPPKDNWRTLQRARKTERKLMTQNGTVLCHVSISWGTPISLTFSDENGRRLSCAEFPDALDILDIHTEKGNEKAVVLAQVRESAFRGTVVSLGIGGGYFRPIITYVIQIDDGRIWLTLDGEYSSYKHGSPPHRASFCVSSVNAVAGQFREKDSYEALIAGAEKAMNTGALTEAEQMLSRAIGLEGYEQAPEALRLKGEVRRKKLSLLRLNAIREIAPLPAEPCDASSDSFVPHPKLENMETIESWASSRNGNRFFSLVRYEEEEWDFCQDINQFITMYSIVVSDREDTVINRIQVFRQMLDDNDPPEYFALPTHPAFCVSEEGETFAIGKNSAELYNSDDGRLLWSEPLDEWCEWLNFTHEDKCLVASGKNGSRFLDGSTGKDLYQRFPMALEKAADDIFRTEDGRFFRFFWTMDEDPTSLA